MSPERAGQRPFLGREMGRKSLGKHGKPMGIYMGYTWDIHGIWIVIWDVCINMEYDGDILEIHMGYIYGI